MYIICLGELFNTFRLFPLRGDIFFLHLGFSDTLNAARGAHLNLRIVISILLHHSLPSKMICTIFYSFLFFDVIFVWFRPFRVIYDASAYILHLLITRGYNSIYMNRKYEKPMILLVLSFVYLSLNIWINFSLWFWMGSSISHPMVRIYADISLIAQASFSNLCLRNGECCHLLSFCQTSL